MLLDKRILIGTALTNNAAPKTKLCQIGRFLLAMCEKTIYDIKNSIKPTETRNK